MIRSDSCCLSGVSSERVLLRRQWYRCGPDEWFRRPPPPGYRWLCVPVFRPGEPSSPETRPSGTTGARRPKEPPHKEYHFARGLRAGKKNSKGRRHTPAQKMWVEKDDLNSNDTPSTLFDSVPGTGTPLESTPPLSLGATRSSATGLFSPTTSHDPFIHTRPPPTPSKFFLPDPGPRHRMWILGS